MPLVHPLVRLLGALLMGSALAGAAEAPFELVGVMSAGAEVQISLHDNATGASKWIALGAVAGGYRFASFEAANETAVLIKDGVETRLRLVAARVKPGGDASGKLTPAAAKSIYHNLRQLAATADQYYLENAKTEATLADLVGSDKYMKRLVVVAGEDYRTLTFKAGVPVVLTTAGGDVIPADAGAGVNATYAFHPVRAGDTGLKIAAATHSALADLVALNPDVNFSKLSVGDILRVK